MLGENVSVLVVGDPTSGTTEFCCYMASTYLKSGDRVVFIESDQPVDLLDQQFELFGIDVSTMEKEQKLAIVSCLQEPTGSLRDKRTIKAEDLSNLEEIIEKVEEGIVRVGGSPVKVIFDSLTPLFSIHDATKIERFFKALNSMVKVSGRLTAVVHSGAVQESQIMRIGDLADGILEVRVDGYFRRFVRLSRFKNLNLPPRWVPFDLDLEAESQSTVLSWKKS
jgi:KaiC/GvpD/RAD55 family RecA-like ATPase